MGCAMVSGILFLLYLVFGRVVPWTLSVTMTLLIGRMEKKIWLGLLLVGLMGMVGDGMGMRPFGISSAVLLGLYGLAWMINRYYRDQWAWWYVLGAGGEIVYRLVVGEVVTWQAVIWQLLALWMIRWVLHRFARPEGIYVGK